MLSLHRRNSLRRTLYHLHNRETFPYSSKDNFDHYLVIHSWITFVPSCQTCGKAHIRCGTQHGIPYGAYDKSIGDDLRPSSFFCCGQSLSLTQLHTLQLRQEPLLWLIYFELLQKHVKVCALWKYHQASWSISIDLDAQYVSSFIQVFLWKSLFKQPFMLSRNSTSFRNNNMLSTYTYQKCL